MKLFVFRLLALFGLIFGFSVTGKASSFDTLEKAPLFAFGGVGDAGTTSEGEIAFHTIFTSESAETNFLRLLKSGNSQAKCYALVGLRLKNRAVFNEQVKPFITSKQEVQTCSGCSMSKKLISTVVASIQRGNYNERAIAKPRPR